VRRVGTDCSLVMKELSTPHAALRRGNFPVLARVVDKLCDLREITLGRALRAPLGFAGEEPPAPAGGDIWYGCSHPASLFVQFFNVGFSSLAKAARLCRKRPI
jgi:hypothetical protein